MPQALIALLPAIIGSAATVGTTLFQHFSQPGGPSASDIAAQQAQQQKDAMASQQADRAKSAAEEAIQQKPNVQSMLGGSVSPDYYANVIANSSGNADQLGAVQKALAMNGINPNPNSGLTSGNTSFSSGTPNMGGSIPNIMQFLKQSGMPDFSSLTGSTSGSFNGGS